jgi:hypothetical protein
MIFGRNCPFEQAIRRHIIEQAEVFRRNSDRRGLSVDRAMQAHELRDKKLPAPSRFAKAKIYFSSLEKSIYASSHRSGVSQAKSPRRSGRSVKMRFDLIGEKGDMTTVFLADTHHARRPETASITRA